MVAKGFQFGGVAKSGEGAVSGDAFLGLGDEGGGKVGGELALFVAAFGEGEDVGTEDEVGGAGVLLALEFFHRLTEKLAVEIEADGSHVTGLFCAEEGAGAADFEVAHRDAEAAAEGGVLANGIEPLAGVASGDGIAREKKKGVGLAVRAPDTATELIEVREAKAVGAVDENGVGVGNVDAALDDGGGEKDVGFAFDELVHHGFEFVLFHLTMADHDFGFGDEFLDAIAQDLDGADAVVKKENLAAASEFVLNGLFNQAFVVLMNLGFDGITVGRRGVDGGHVAHAHEGKVEGAGDGGGGKGQDVDLTKAFLEGFLVFDSKALFFIDDNEP